MRLRLGLVALLLLLSVSLSARAVSVGLTVQEALYPGFTTGVARSSEPVSLSVPLPDSASTGVTGTSTLGLTGASVGQFRVLTTYDSGRAQWVQIDTQLSLSAATPSTALTLTSGGSGNFGGSTLATDNGSNITVDTGAAVFTIYKANFNGFDTVVIGGTTVVATGTSDGFVIVGPAAGGVYPANVTCSPDSGGATCNVEYASKYDAGSTCSVEENGPVRAVLACTYDFEDSGHHVYMHGTARLHFYLGKTYAKVVSVLRNADDGTSNTFETAYKGIRGYELRTTLNITTTSNTYTIADHSGGPTTGTLTGTDTAYFYQAESSIMQHESNYSTAGGGFGAYQHTDTGYTITKNGSNVQTGTISQRTEGWCDVANGSGVGVQLGTYQSAASYPKGCRFGSAGQVAAISILPAQSAAPYYLEWPSWNEMTTNLVSFHTSAPSSLADDFLRFQHYLVGRVTDFTYYNTVNALPAPLVDPAVEDAYLTTVANAASPSISSGNKWAVANATQAEDFGTTSATFTLQIFRRFAWDLETDYRYDYLTNFLTRGMTGRFLQARHFYEYCAQYMLPHSDGFGWHTGHTSVVNGFGEPVTLVENAANNTKGVHSNGGSVYINWRDQEHGFWYGMTLAYYLTGDEFLKDAMVDQQKSWYLLTDGYPSGGEGPGSSELTTNGTSATKVFGNNWTNALIGQVMLIGTSKEPFEVASVADTTHLTFTTSAGVRGTTSFQVFSGLGNQRAIANSLTGAARFSELLRGIGDADADDVQTYTQRMIDKQLKSKLCVGSYPANCLTGASTIETTALNEGFSRERGFHWGGAGTTGTWCGVAHTYRGSSVFQESLLAEAMLEYAETRGSSYADYAFLRDAAYGISQWALGEMWAGGETDHGTDGLRGGFVVDRKNQCHETYDEWVVDTNGTAVTRVSGPNFDLEGRWTGGYALMWDGTSAFILNGSPAVILSVTDADHLTLTASVGVHSGYAAYWREENYDEPYANGAQTMWAPYFASYEVTGIRSWEQRFKLSLQRSMNIQGVAGRDLLGHLVARTIKAVTDVAAPVLTDVTLTGFTDNGGGSYSLQWTPISGATYRVKWHAKQIVDLIGFNASTNTYTGDPATTMNWFSAENVSTAPSCSGTCSLTIATGVTSLNSGNFSVKSLAEGAPDPTSTLRRFRLRP